MKINKLNVSVGCDISSLTSFPFIFWGITVTLQAYGRNVLFHFTHPILSNFSSPWKSDGGKDEFCLPNPILPYPMSWDLDSLYFSVEMKSVHFFFFAERKFD